MTINGEKNEKKEKITRMAILGKIYLATFFDEINPTFIAEFYLLKKRQLAINLSLGFLKVAFKSLNFLFQSSSSSSSNWQLEMLSKLSCKFIFIYIFYTHKKLGKLYAKMEKIQMIDRCS